MADRSYQPDKQDKSLKVLLIDEEALSYSISIPVSTIKRLTKQGLIPAYKVGSYWRYDVAEVVQSLRQRALAAGGGQKRPSLIGEFRRLMKIKREGESEMEIPKVGGPANKDAHA